MADKLKKNQRILNSAWDDETLSYREELLARRKKEEEKRAQEERVRQEIAAARTPSLDSFGSLEGMREALNRPSPEPQTSPQEEDEGYSIWDIGVAARAGAGSVVKGALGLPVDLANLAGDPQYDEAFSSFGDRTIRQPEVVTGMRQAIDSEQARLMEQQGSDAFKRDSQGFADQKGIIASGKYLLQHPQYLGLQAFQQGPQLIAGGVGPGVTGKVIAGALSAAGQAEESVTTELRRQGKSEEEIARKGSEAFAESLALNAATPYALKSTFLEGVVSRAARGRVTDGVLKAALANTSKEVQEGVITEVGDQLIQNLNSNKKWDEGLGQAAVLGAAFSAAVAGPAATLESAAEAGKAASKLQGYLKEQRFAKEAFDANRTNQPRVAPEPVQGDLFGGGGSLSTPITTTDSGAVGVDSEGNQQLLRTRRAAISAQLEQDKAQLSEFQNRIDRAPFAEEAANALTNQERTDMSRLQERIPKQEALLRDIDSSIVPIQNSLNLGNKRQPKTPKFTGAERTVGDIKSDYFKTQPVQGPAPMSPELRKAAQAAKIAEHKLTKKEASDADKKAKAAHAAAKRKYMENVRKGLMDLPVEARANKMAEAAVTWQVNNPLVLPSKQAAPTKSATEAPVAPTPVDENTPSVPISQLSDALQNAPEGSVALPSVAPTSGTGVTLQDVGKAVGGGKRDKLASRLSYMVEDGNLEIVQSQDQIPGEIGKMQQQGKGWYDPESGKTYLVAGNLDSKNIKGDILATLAHETKHAGDFGGSAGLAKSFKSFIGAEANSRLAAKIRGAAGKGDKSAEATMNRINKSYQGKGLTQDQMDSEIVANYITTEGKKSGARTALYRSVVSPLRTGAKKLLRSNDVSLGDIHYMADRLVNEVAQRGEGIEGGSGGVALPSVLGFTASGFQDAADAGRSFRDRQGSMKFVISDKDSTLVDGSVNRLINGEKVNLGEILNHPELYSNYKGLPRTIKVEADPKLKGESTRGYWERNKFKVSISPDALDAAVSDPNSFRGLLLHEVQHAIQDIEGHPRGGNADMFKDKVKHSDLKQSMNNMNSLLGGVINSLINPNHDNSSLVAALPPDIKEAVAKLVIDSNKYKSHRAENAKIIASLLEEGVLNEANLQMIARLNDLGDRTKVAENALREVDQEAYANYWNLHGEHEARFTQDNINKSLDELPVNPEEALGYGDTAIYTENEPYMPLTQRAHGIVPKAKPMPSVVEQVEEDNRSWWNKTKDSSRVVRIVDDMFSTTEGFGKDLFKVLDQRQGLRGDLSLRAESLGAKIEAGIREAAKGRKTTINKISTELEGKLKEINKLKTKAEREAAVKELDTLYPGVGTALNDLRNLKWALARKLIEQRAAEGTDLTPKEQSIYGKIVENAETYTTRAYVSNQMPGKKFAKRRLADIKKNPTGDEAIRYNEAVQFLVDTHLAIPSLEEMQSMEGKDIRKFYENYFGDSTGMDVAPMADKLNSIPRKSAEEYNKKATEIAKELMGFKQARSNVARGYGGARQNRTILEGREKVPDEIRFLMGEITNPLAAEMMSVARLVNLYTQTNMLQRMVEEGKDKYYKDYNEGDFNHQLKGEAYGPMQGKWVSPTGRKFIEPAVEIGLDLEQALSTSNKDIGTAARFAINSLKVPAQMLTGGVKLVDLVTSPVAMAWNYIGAYGIVAQNGANPKYIAKAQRNTARAIKSHYDASKYSKEQMSEIQELIRARVLDSATVGEFQQSFYDNMFRFLEDEQTENNSNLMLKVQRAIKDGSMAFKDVYAFMDMWAKVAAYYDRKDYLSNFYKANGDSKSNEDIIREAGQDITAANISYTRAIKAIKAMERNVPFFTMYLTYFSEVPRSLVSSAILAGKDLHRGYTAKTPEAKNIAYAAGTKRAVGTLTVTALLSSLVNMYLNSLGDDEERRRNTDPTWEQKGVPIKMGTTSDNKLVTFNLLRSDPNGPLNEFLVRMSNLGTDEDPADALVETFKSQFVQAKPVMATWRLINGLAGRATENYEDDHGDWADSLDKLSWGDDKNLGRNLASVLEGFTPRVIKGASRSLTGTIGNRHYEFDPVAEPGIAFAQALGLTPVVRDPEFSLEMATNKYRKAKTKANDELSTLKKRLGKYDGKELLGEFKDIVEDEEKAYNDLYKVYDGTKAFNGYYADKDYAKAADTIIKDAKLGSVGSDIARNSFNVRFITPKYVNEWRDARIQVIKEMKDPKEKSLAMANLRKEYKMVWDYLGNANKRKE